ncbi:MAG: hypothetical protein ISR69_08700 [Gammaproteobacteria bacterium]|nr:hypothetical protein [Gammaproteobacteria bacterium]
MHIRCILFIFLYFISPYSYSTIIVVNDKTQWLSYFNASSVVENNFDGIQQDFIANSTNSLDYFNLSLVGGVADESTGITGDGFLQGEVDYSGSDQLELDFSFDASFGFAFTDFRNDSISNPSALDLSEIAILVGTEHWVLSEIVHQQYSDIPFLGFVFDSTISGFTMAHSQGVRSSMTRTSEEFYIGSFLLAKQAALISEPPTYLLLFFIAYPIFIRRKKLALL